MNYLKPSQFNTLWPFASLAHKLQSPRCACFLEIRPGCHLINSFGYTSVMPIAVPKKKRSLLPLLTVLFLFSYGLMTMLIVEQGSAIQSQSNLIKVLMSDSIELWAAKGKAIGNREMARAQAEAKTRAHAPSTQAQAPSSQTPSTQAPSTQAPSTQVPVIEAKPEASAKAGQKARRSQKALPSRPPVEVTDPSDMRRVSISI